MLVILFIIITGFQDVLFLYTKAIQLLGIHQIACPYGKKVLFTAQSHDFNEVSAATESGVGVGTYRKAVTILVPLQHQDVLKFKFMFCRLFPFLRKLTLHLLNVIYTAKRWIRTADLYHLWHLSSAKGRKKIYFYISPTIMLKINVISPGYHHCKNRKRLLPRRLESPS